MSGAALERTQAGDSVTVAAWTVVSRITGFLRVAVIAAVLGPTFLGNAFLAVDVLPMLILQFLAGGLIGSVLIPGLVGAVDAKDRRAASEVAGGFLTTVLLVTVATAAVAMLAGPLIAEVLTAGVDDDRVAQDQEQAIRTLLLLVIPQLPLYALALTGGAIMNAHGRYALAAAAPVAENLGVMSVLSVVAIAFGTGDALDRGGDGHLLVLGLGSTGAVAVHAGLMLWGAHRTGVRLSPRAGWRDERVRRLLRRMLASFGQTSVLAGRFFAMLVVAGTVPAGVVALRLATNFLYLPVQVGARPVALTMLPALSRLHAAGAAQDFRDQCSLGLARVAFLAIPAAAGYAVLADPLAEAVSYGAFAGTTGVELVAACLTGLAIAVLAESAFELLSHASYARGDARAPLLATVAGTAASGAILPWAIVLDGVDALLVIGLALSAGSGVAVWHLRRHLVAQLPAPRQGATQPVLRTLAATGAMVLAALAVSAGLSSMVDGQGAGLFVVTGAGLAGAAVFLGVQRAWRSPELAFFASGLVGRGASR